MQKEAQCARTPPASQAIGVSADCLEAIYNLGLAARPQLRAYSYHLFSEILPNEEDGQDG